MTIDDRIKIDNHTMTAIERSFELQGKRERMRVELARAWLDVELKQIEVAGSYDALRRRRQADAYMRRTIYEARKRRVRAEKDLQKVREWLHYAKALLVPSMINDKRKVMRCWACLFKLLGRDEWDVALAVGSLQASGIYSDQFTWHYPKKAPKSRVQVSTSAMGLWKACKKRHATPIPGTPAMALMHDTFRAIATGAEKVIGDLFKELAEVEVKIETLRKEYAEFNK